jgi:hypothetical protein
MSQRKYTRGIKCSPPRAAWLALVVIALAFSSLTVWGQNAVGTITGVITDPTGAVVPGASVVAIDTETQAHTDSVTNSAGYYQLNDLQPGPYILQAQAKGFKKLVRLGILLQVQDRLAVDLKLALGSVAETVSVTAESPLLQTQDLGTGEVVTYTMIQDLPQLNRDALQLITLSGNVQGGGGEAGGGSDTTINGGRTAGIDYLVDGVSVVVGQGHTVNSETPGIDDVQEFKVMTNGLTADVGRVSGGAVTVATKAGTNDFHGQLYTYYQDAFLNDSGWYQKAAGGTKTPFHQYDSGAAGGGPVLLPHVYNGKNKTFWYGTYETFREATAGQLEISQYPTATERTGDLSGMWMTQNGTTYTPSMYEPCYDASYCAAPATVAANAGYIGNPGGTEVQKLNPFPAGKNGVAASVIPSGLVSTYGQVSVNTLKNVPLPNRTPTAGYSDNGNYVGSQNNVANNTSYSVRIDQTFSDKSRMYGRFTHAADANGTTSWGGPQIPSSSSRVPGGWALTLNYNYVFNPTLSLSVTAGGFYNPYASGNLLGAGASSINFGFDPVTQGLMNGNMLYNEVNYEYGNTCPGNCPFSNSASSNTSNSANGTLGGSFTKVLTKHTLQYGAETRKYYDDTYNTGSGQAIFISDPITQYSYDAGYGSILSQLTGMGSFMLGLNDLMSANSFFNRDLAQNYYAAYIQDSYKVSRRLTLSLGLRWDMQSPTTERNNKLYIWNQEAKDTQFTVNSGYNWQTALAAAGLSKSDAANVTEPQWAQTGIFQSGLLQVAGTPEHPSRFVNGYHPAQFAPRLGGAYKLDEKTVLRAYVGMMYLPTTGDASGFLGSTVVSTSSGAANSWHQNNYGIDPSVGSWANPYLPSQITTFSLNQTVANFQETGSEGSGVSSFMHMPHEYDINVGIQRELPHQFLVEANYSGNISHSLEGLFYVSEFPKQLFVPQNHGLYTTTGVPSPNAGQTEANSYSGATQPLALLEYPMPYFGPVTDYGRNWGKTNFESLTLRAEKRLSHGYQILANFQYAKLMDDVGGPEETGLSGGIGTGGVGSHEVQSVDQISNVYGISPLDEKYRFNVFYLYQLPFGKGRTWLANPEGIGGAILNGAVGGWEFAGTTGYNSGRPVNLAAGTNINLNNNVRAEQTFNSCVFAGCSELQSEYFRGGKSVLVPPGQSLPVTTAPAFNSAAITLAAPFTYGTMPPEITSIRNPGDFTTNLSLMKAFPFWPGHGETRYVQFRIEANNAFNVAGLAGYNSDLGEAGFGTITGIANQERHMQGSIRVVF